MEDQHRGGGGGGVSISMFRVLVNDNQRGLCRGSPRSDSEARRQITSPPSNLWNVAALESLWVITNNDPVASLGKGTIDFFNVAKAGNMTLASRGLMRHRLWNEISIFGRWLLTVCCQSLCKVENHLDCNDSIILSVVLRNAK